MENQRLGQRWAQAGSNHRPSPRKGAALPLSYGPTLRPYPYPGGALFQRCGNRFLLLRPRPSGGRGGKRAVHSLFAAKLSRRRGAAALGLKLWGPLPLGPKPCGTWTCGPSPRENRTRTLDPWTFPPPRPSAEGAAAARQNPPPKVPPLLRPPTSGRREPHNPRRRSAGGPFRFLPRKTSRLGIPWV